MPRLTSAQQKLVTDNMLEAERIGIAIWRRSGGDKDELVSLAYLGLVESALRYRYDPDITPFIVFAKPRIRGAIMDAARAVDHVPRSVRTRYKAGDTSVAAQVEAKPVYIDEAIMHHRASLQSDGLTDDTALSDLLTTRLADVVRAMPIVQQTILALHYYAGLELKEIASYLRVPDSRVGNIHIGAVMIVLEELREALKERPEP